MVFRNKRDLVGGAIIAVIGVLGIIEGQRLGAGTLAEIRPGFFPRALGALLVLLGLLMARGEAGAAPPVALVRPEFRGWICIILGVASFIVLGPFAGLVPAAFACVFISALGDKQATFKSAALLGLGVAACGAVLFHYLLQLDIPLFGIFL
jgi:hypothetical protein